MRGRGERDFVLGTRNIFLLRSTKQEREARNLERGSTGTLILEREKKYLYRSAGTQERKRKIEEHGHAECETSQERAPISENSLLI